MIKRILTVLSVLIALSSTTLMAQNVTSNTTEKPATSQHVQNFELAKTLLFQVRYQDGQAVSLKMQNKGNKPVQVKIFNDTYTLAANDSTTIQHPNLSRVFVALTPHHYLQTLFPLPYSDKRFAQTFQFEMPQKISSTTDK